MSSTETNPPVLEPPPIRVRVRPQPVNKPKRQPPYAVVLHNDDVNGFDWVIRVLTAVLRCGGTRALWLTLRTHVGGRSVVWTGSLEVAELKAEQIQAYGPDPLKASAGAQPLKVTVEAMPE
jgi:ATP-dependent Clp protease adaptor protein ClpS